MRAPVAPAVRAAWHLLRRHWLGWLVAILAVQGTLILVALPLLGYLFRTFLAVAGIDGINQATLLRIVSEPVPLLLLLLYAVLAVALIVVELGFFAAFSHALWDGRTFTVRTAIAAAAAAIRPLASWQAPLLALYVILLLPLAHFDVGSTLTQHVAIPKFVSGELTKTTAGLIAYVALIALLVYAAFRLMPTIAGLVRGRTSVLGAMRAALALTRPRHLRLALVLIATSAAVVAVIAVVAALGVVPVALAEGTEGGPVAVAIALTLTEAARFLVVGAAAVFLAGVNVALVRGAEDAAAGDTVPAELHTRRGGSPRGTRVVATAVLTVAGLSVAAQATAAAVAVPPTDAAGDVMIVAHRGYTAGGVENSIEALHAAAEAGADMVELDIQETADRGLVVIHDTDLSRLAGIDRDVYEMTTAELAATSIRQGDFRSTIPTFEEFAAEARELGIALLVEVKPHGHEAAGFADRVAAAVRALDPDGTDWVQSLNGTVLGEIAAADPDRTTAFVIGLQLGDLPTTDAEAIVIEDWSFADAMLATAHLRDQRVLVWTVNDADTIRGYLGRGVDGIITDEVATAVVSRQLAVQITNDVSRYLVEALPLIRP